MIDRPYLLVMTLPCFVDADGGRSAQELWQKDLVEHLAQIRDLTLLAPLEHGPAAEKTLPIEPHGHPGRLSYVDLPPCNSLSRTILALPKILVQTWRAVGRAQIVHGNAGGWPISFGWFALPMAKLRGKFTVCVVESGSWRLGFHRPFRLRGFVEACLFEGFGRLLVNIADVAAFTHVGYRDSMLARSRRDHGHIISASWINQANILGPEEAEAVNRRKLADPGRPLRVVFAATLKDSKGVAPLLEAAAILERRGVRVDLDIYGAGPLRAECEAAARARAGSVALRLRGSLDYGPPFFDMLLDHDVMVVANLSDEQPRVIYDSFARALPVIASNTAGNAQCVTDGRDGRLVAVGDAAALADAIEWAGRNRPELAAMGVRALDVAGSLTHDQMHARRAAIIEAALARKFGDPVPA